jgi:hypothetical protein
MTKPRPPTPGARKPTRPTAKHDNSLQQFRPGNNLHGTRHIDPVALVHKTTLSGLRPGLSITTPGNGLLSAITAPDQNDG